MRSQMHGHTNHGYAGNPGLSPGAQTTTLARASSTCATTATTVYAGPTRVAAMTPQLQQQPQRAQIRDSGTGTAVSESPHQRDLMRNAWASRVRPPAFGPAVVAGPGSIPAHLLGLSSSPQVVEASQIRQDFGVTSPLQIRSAGPSAVPINVSGNASRPKPSQSIIPGLTVRHSSVPFAVMTAWLREEDIDPWKYCIEILFSGGRVARTSADISLWLGDPAAGAPQVPPIDYECHSTTTQPDDTGLIRVEIQASAFCGQVGPVFAAVNGSEPCQVGVVSQETILRIDILETEFATLRSQSLQKPKGQGLTEASAVMNITVSNLAGVNALLEVSAQGTVSDLKSLIHDSDSFGIPPVSQRLIFDDKVLDDNEEPLARCGVKDGAIVTLVKIAIEEKVWNRVKKIARNYGGMGRHGTNDGDQQVEEVKELDLYNRLKSETEDAEQCFLILPFMRSLSKLNLSWCGLGPEEAEMLAAVLPQMHNLKELYIGNNDIREAGAKQLAVVLPKMPSLRCLNLERCFGDTGARYLAAVLPNMPDLEELNLSGNNLGANMQQRIRAGTKAAVHFCAWPPLWCAPLLEADIIHSGGSAETLTQ